MKINLQTDPLLGWSHYVFAETIPGIADEGDTVWSDTLCKLRSAGIASVEVSADWWKTGEPNKLAQAYRTAHKPSWRTR